MVGWKEKDMKRGCLGEDVDLNLFHGGPQDEVGSGEEEEEAGEEEGEVDPSHQEAGTSALVGEG